MLNPADEDTLARLRVVVAAGLPVPSDLARNALIALEAFADRDERLFARNQHIRRAAVMIDGTAWARACELEKEVGAIERIWNRLQHTRPEVMTFRGELHAAALRYKLPRTARSFLNIIQ